MTHAIVLPGPILLADPLPSGWRRCSSLGCGAPAGHAGEHVAEAVPPVAVAGPEVDVGAEVSGGAPTLADVAAVIDLAQRALDGAPLCAETMLAIDALESAESLVADLRGAQTAPTVADARATMYAAGERVRAADRSARIEAAARAYVLAEIAYHDATTSHDEAALDAAALAQSDAYAALVAALCTCNGRGPDPACVDHGAAIAAWQRENTP